MDGGGELKEPQRSPSPGYFTIPASGESSVRSAIFVETAAHLSPSSVRSGMGLEVAAPAQPALLAELGVLRSL
jgi:hypothetical protein